MNSASKPRFQTRRIVLLGDTQRQAVCALANNAPPGIEVVFREASKPRTADQNALMWAGALTDMEKQAWVAGRQYTAEVWHEHFKREYLPEEAEEGITKDGYRKWAYLPTGERVLVGSTTMLTKRGFSEYLEKIYAFGAGLGVQFGVNERMFA